MSPRYAGARARRLRILRALSERGRINLLRAPRADAVADPVASSWVEWGGLPGAVTRLPEDARRDEGSRSSA